MRELLTVQLGQCGNQVGCELFDTLLREATASHQNDLLSEVRHSFFRETIHGQQADSTTGVGSLRARAVLIDTEPKVKYLDGHQLTVKPRLFQQLSKLLKRQDGGSIVNQMRSHSKVVRLTTGHSGNML